MFVVRLCSCRKYTSETSYDALRRDILAFPSIGILGDEGTLECWCMTRVDGVIGVLRTSESVRRRGYGRAMVQYLLQQYAGNPLRLPGPDGSETTPRLPFCYTTKVNIPSMTLFQGFGFKKCGGSTWLWPVRAINVLSVESSARWKR
jgi:ribosomal protein S18 acetylase RimI-like enzyme